MYNLDFLFLSESGTERSCWEKQILESKQLIIKLLHVADTLRWVSEKSRRKAALKELQDLTRRGIYLHRLKLCKNIFCFSWKHQVVSVSARITRWWWRSWTWRHRSEKKKEIQLSGDSGAALQSSRQPWPRTVSSQTRTTQDGQLRWCSGYSRKYLMNLIKIFHSQLGQE